MFNYDDNDYVNFKQQNINDSLSLPPRIEIIFDPKTDLTQVGLVIVVGAVSGFMGLKAIKSK